MCTEQWRLCITIKRWLKFYANGTVMIVAVAGYIGVAAYGLYPLAGFLLLLLAYGLSVGVLVAVFQVVYGAIHYFHRSRGNKYYLSHCKGGALWLVGLIAWLIGLGNGYVLTA